MSHSLRRGALAPSSLAAPEVQLSPAIHVLVPLSVTLALWLISSNPLSLAANLSAFALLQLVWTTFRAWSRRKSDGLPLFSLIGFAYWVYFALPLYVGERIMGLARGVTLVSEQKITLALEAALFGVMCMFAGMKLHIPGTQRSQEIDLDDSSTSTWVYVRIIMIVGTLGNIYPSVVYVFGAEFRQVMMILISVVPTVALGILLSRYWRGLASPMDGLLILIAVAMRVTGALAFGWLGPIVGLSITMGSVYVVVRKKIPWAAILLTICSFVFLQTSKNAFRDTFWNDRGQNAASQTSLLDRVQFWVNQSIDQWSAALQGGGPGSSGKLAGQALERASLLTQVAHVLDVTPSEVPYQGGQTYSYIAITLIPRFLWPDKPSISEANQFYQLAYGLTDQKSLQYVSIAVGVMAEAYINFGWLGVALVMFGVGILLRGYDRLFLSNQRSILLSVIGLTLLPQLLSVESQLGVYVGGLVQQAGLSFLVFLPVTRRRSQRSHKLSSAPPISRATHQRGAW